MHVWALGLWCEKQHQNSKRRPPEREESGGREKMSEILGGPAEGRSRGRAVWRERSPPEGGRHNQRHTNTNTHANVVFFCPEFCLLFCADVVFLVPSVCFLSSLSFFNLSRMLVFLVPFAFFLSPRLFTYFVPFAFFSSRYRGVGPSLPTPRTCHLRQDKA